MATPVTIANKPALLSLDFGNFELKAFDGRTITQIRSLQKPLAQGQRLLNSTNASPIIEINGLRWHVGTQCSRYGNYEATVQSNKSQLAQLHLAACIKESGQYHLVVCHHSPDDYQDFLQNALLGVHSYIRNGVQIKAEIKSVEVIHEGLGAYSLAKIRNYVPNRGYTVLIDLGGSTWLSSLYAADGELVDHDVHERDGTYRLAVAIASDSRLAKPLLESTSVTSPDPVVIQDGFCNGNFYGESDFCWAEWMNEYLDPWWKGIVQTLKSRYQTYLPDVKRFIVTGGGSHLVNHKLMSNPAFLVMPEANTSNVQGAYYIRTRAAV
jgi:hypothetical protein